MSTLFFENKNSESFKIYLFKFNFLKSKFNINLKNIKIERNILRNQAFRTHLKRIQNNLEYITNQIMRRILNYNLSKECELLGHQNILRTM